jgi:hypothetical protein
MTYGGWKADASWDCVDAYAATDTVEVHTTDIVVKDSQNCLCIPNRSRLIFHDLQMRAFWKFNFERPFKIPVEGSDKVIRPDLELKIG